MPGSCVAALAMRICNAGWGEVRLHEKEHLCVEPAAGSKHAACCCGVEAAWRDIVRSAGHVLDQTHGVHMSINPEIFLG